MPGLPELEQLAKSYSLAIGFLMVAQSGLLFAVVHLYRENLRLYGRIEALLERRVEVLEVILGRRDVL